MTRTSWLISTHSAVVAVAVTAFVQPPPKLVWNASASVPIGLYAVRPAGVPRVHELVVVRPPTQLAAFLARRDYLAKGVPLLKHVLALPGQRVCRFGREIVVDGRPMGEALARDQRGRALPVWRGCRVLGPGQVFLMNRRPKDSFDGRYFGPLPSRTIVGRAAPLWIPGARP